MTGVISALHPPRRHTRIVARADLPPLSPQLYLARAILILVVVVAGGLLLQLVVVSSLQQRASQQQLFDRFRAELAQGTAPIGPTDAEGRELALGDPVAFVEIPEIGVRQVVVEGTTSASLFAGPGHRRDTPLPGQEGVSVLLGRRAAFGGPFADLAKLEEGSNIRVTTGQGEFDFEVIGLRQDGDPLPPPPQDGKGRLLLATADGSPLFPDGVLRVDAEFVGDAQPGPARLVSAAPGPEQLLGSDTSRLWMLTLWMQALVVAVVGAVWAWHRWGRAQTWIVFLPVLLLFSTYVAGHTAELLPNLL